MEKHIIRWSYWLGILSVVLAFITRALNVFGVTLAIQGRGNPIAYHTFLYAAFLFFAATIATSSYASFKSQKP